MRIALAGNPNSGKTTMFNAITGSSEKVGNWAGVTVDKKEQTIKKSLYKGIKTDTLLAVDLPGAYSMSPFTSEESVTSEYIKNERPDVIINIVDATNLSRSLFFTTQLLELGVPMVVALNKADINEKKKTKIDTAALSERLGCPVFDTVSTSKKGLREVIAAAVARKGERQSAPYKASSACKTREEAEAADKERFTFVNSIVEAVETRCVLTKDRTAQDKVDAVLTNKWLGIPIFAIVMFLVFQISQVWVGTPLAELLNIPLGLGQERLAAFLASREVNELLSALLVDGIVGGVMAVIGFLPLVMVMYFLIALLEDCGYLARVSVVLDPIFKKVGLSGKSVIPFVITTGCAVPGIMACRTIKDERERRATAMLSPFMPCGAKIPVISLFAGAFFKNSGWVSTLMYFMGIFLIFIGALLVNKITGNSKRFSYFIIELPEYKLPSFWGAFKSMCHRGWDYIVKAATIILLCNTAVHIMQTFNWQFAVVPEGGAEGSILATIAKPFAYIFIPIVGVLSWQLAAAAITGFIAKENVVGTLAVCFAISQGMMDTPDSTVGQIMGISQVAALAYLMFNMFSPPCFAAIGAMNSEMKSAKWFWSGIALQLSVGYIIAYSVFQVGTLIMTHALHSSALWGLIPVLIMIGIIIALCIRGDMNGRKKAKKEA